MSWQDDVISVSDLDKVMTDGLGMRYAFMGPFETCHLNAEGIVWRFHVTFLWFVYVTLGSLPQCYDVPCGHSDLRRLSPSISWQYVVRGD